MPNPQKATNIDTRERAEVVAMLMRFEYPGWEVKITEQPGGAFTVTATPPANAEATPERVAESSITHPGATDAKLAPLLDLIAKAESAGNYNAHFGNAGNTDPKFTKMSIDEVIAWQKAFVNSGSISSAVGRYQIIRKTLKSLLKPLDLKGTEKYDEKMQDRMAVALLKRRDLEGYLVGKISENRFINNIAMEWAGLPTMTGESYYGPPNKAQVTLAEVQAAVRAIL